MNLSEYSDNQLIEIWMAFWYSADVEPDIRHTPDGVTEGQWIVMVYNELKSRNIEAPTTFNFWEA